MSISLLPKITKRRLDVAFWIAGANWEMWRQDFDYIGSYKRIPVLSRGRFLAFVSAYNLFQRQTTSARLHALRAIKASNLKSAFGNSSGTGIDILATSLKSSGGTVNLELSLLSKLAAFCEPADFNAYDQTAQKGLIKWTSGFRRGSAVGYSAYCIRINQALNGRLGVAISRYLRTHMPPTSNIAGFTRRMLDVYLMIEGGRWASVI